MQYGMDHDWRPSWLFDHLASCAKTTLAFLCLFLVADLIPQLLAANPSQAHDLPEPGQLTVKVGFLTEEIQLDGRLDEAVWKEAEVATGFWQFTPGDRLPGTEKTEVRVLQDERNIYFGILCYDSEPEKIIATDMRRDATLGNDDYIGLYLDTYHDHRNFYYFSTNPLGTRRDGIVTDARFYNTAWDGIWTSRARVGEEGWSAEIKIPFSTLRFAGERPMTWGFNISRSIRRKQERDHWAPIPRDLGQKGTWRGELFGHLTGIEAGRSTEKWEVEPFLLAGRLKSYPTDLSESRLDYGGDVHYHFNPNLRADFSVNTDFAQVEADQEVVNFSRFPLFFPEKREFFLDNAGLFNVGFEGETMMFYSRRIGLSEGQVIPLQGAAKLSGRVGPYTLGFINVQTDSASLPLASDVASSNQTVLRFKRDLFTNSSIGTILTNRQSGGDFNRLAGLDANVWLGPSLRAEGLFAKTFNPSDDRGDVLGIGRLIFAQHDLVADLRYYAIGPHFLPEMGFVWDQDIRRGAANVEYTQWINRSGIRSLAWVGSYLYDTLFDYDFYGRELSGGVTLNFESGDTLGYLHRSDAERIYTPFTVGPITIPANDYTNGSQVIAASTNPSRPLSLTGNLGWMDYWDGRRRVASVQNNFHPIANLSVDLIYENNRIEHPLAGFTTNTLSNRIMYAFTTDLFVKSFIQWNDLEDRFSTNFLFNYEYRPGSDLYVVYTEVREQWDNLNRDMLTPRDRVLMVKLTFNLRF